MPDQAQPNKPLSGVELKQIIMTDIGNILDQDSMLTSHIAYNRAAYSVTVKIMTGNPIIPNWNNRTASKKSTPQQIEKNEAMASVESFPLQLGEEDTPANLGVERTRQIISPNQSRIENGIPVLISFRGADGDVHEEKVMYEPDMLPDDGGFPDGVTERELDDTEIASVEG